MKGLEPIIATVLLIAFSVGFMIIVGSWVSDLVRDPTKDSLKQGENEIDCMRADVTISDVEYNLTAGILKVTAVNTGTQPLNNFSFVLITSQDATTLRPQNQATPKAPLRTGQGIQFVMNNGGPISGDVEEMVITYICKNAVVKSFPRDL
jgi:hypothetical protein